MLGVSSPESREHKSAPNSLSSERGLARQLPRAPSIHFPGTLDKPTAFYFTIWKLVMADSRLTCPEREPVSSLAISLRIDHHYSHSIPNLATRLRTRVGPRIGPPDNPRFLTYQIISSLSLLAALTGCHGPEEEFKALTNGPWGPRAKPCFLHCRSLQGLRRSMWLDNELPANHQT